MLNRPPRLLPEVLIPHLCAFLRGALESSGRSGYVLGLSGGVDSAVTAALAVRALGPERVQVLFLPAAQSNPQSAVDAAQVADSLGLKLETVSIAAPVTVLSHGLDAAADKGRTGNLAARARMMALFDRSQRDGLLVAGATNKTEYLLGYGTWFGDLAFAVNAIGDLYKTQVWDLARDLELPKAVITKAPSADLWPGQSDEGELGFSYAQADQILHLLLDQRYSTEELAARADVDTGLLARIRAKIEHSHFKRRLPLVCKVQARTVGTDYRHARDLHR